MVYTTALFLSPLSPNFEKVVLDGFNFAFMLEIAGYTWVRLRMDAGMTGPF